MARPRSQIDITCQNPECCNYLKEDGKDIVKRGKNRAGHQQYFCKHCNTWFVETANTPMFHKHLSIDENTRICKLLVEKLGIRGIERATGHHRDTISNLLEDFALHAEALTQFLLKDVELTPFEVDELWSTIKKNKRKLSPEAQVQIMKVTSGSIPV